MSISRKVAKYLSNHGIIYDLLAHRYSEGALQTSHAAHIPEEKLVKAILLVDHDDKHLLVVIPSNHKLNLKKLSKKLERQLRFVPEHALSSFFRDCYPGAIPALGQAYNIEVMWDDSLADLSDVYLEGGDHQTLLHFDHEEFMHVMRHQDHAMISVDNSASERERVAWC